MSREMCYRCFWPKALCWCDKITPMHTHSHIVFLMHPKEFKEEKAATGRLTHLALENSEIRMGISFESDEHVNGLINDPGNHAVLLYPGANAFNLSERALKREDIGDRRLVIFILDGTWSCARKMLRLSPNLQRLPRVMFTPSSLSRWVIKQQPQEGLLSTIEATHELLLALEQSGLDSYPLPAQLLDIFQRMQDYQIQCASDPNRQGYRRRAYSSPDERKAARGASARRRAGYYRKPTET